MGADGGTIPKRCELVKKKRKKEKIEKSYEAATKWRTCQLSQQPLKKPIVCCKLGRLYNKEAVLEAKLDKTLAKNKATEHIHAFSDVKELKLTDNKAWKDNGPEKGDIYIDMNETPWVCPITALPMNGVNNFFVNWKCGCVFSEKAHNELKTDSCYGCGGPMQEQQFIKLYPDEELFLQYEQRIVDEIAQRKQKAGEKKRKTTGDSKGAEHQPKKSKAEEETKFSSIQDNPNVPKAVKSMFTTSEEAKKQPTAHWKIICICWFALDCSLEQMDGLTGEPMLSTRPSPSIGAEGKERFARENHSEIERRRRNKMTHYINELADMVPQCAALGRKPDKLTILRMAVSHMKVIRGANAQSNNLSGTMPSQPSFLTDQELKHLILEAANGFLFVVSCESARVVFVSDSIGPILNVSPEQWLNSPSFYDVIHPQDVEKVRGHLLGTDFSHNSRVLDLKTGTVKREHSSARVHLNCRRGFICRMRIGDVNCLPRLRNRHPIFESEGHSFIPVHCTGYVKNNAPLVGADANPNKHCFVAGPCLVAIARLQLPSMLFSPSSQKFVGTAARHNSNYTFRLTKEGTVTFADEKISQLMNKQSAELLGKLIWTFVDPIDAHLVENAINAATQQQQQIISCKWCKYDPQNPTELFGHLPVSFCISAFTNPHSGKLEFLIASIAVEQDEEGQTDGATTEQNNTMNYYQQHQQMVIGNEHGPNYGQETRFVDPPMPHNSVNPNWPDALSLPGNGISAPTSLNYNLLMNPSPNVYLPNSNALLPTVSEDQRRWLPQFSSIGTAVGLDNASGSLSVWPEQQQHFLQ
ncbi:hypothetical protein niasHS_010090 [Heterodera schachtii]|uniref:Aryl hydrocarbon receptor nuclear translocator homolog n=1 Tax=Heterodera schachtii TaxID=97005 RepID=A0ABD2J0G2_HETSC